MAKHRHILAYVVIYAGAESPEFLFSDYLRTGSSVEYIRIRALVFGAEEQENGGMQEFLDSYSFSTAKHGRTKNGINTLVAGNCCDV